MATLYQQDGVVVTLGPEPVLVEQVLQLQVQLPAGFELQQAQIVGLSMAMGQIPLRLQHHAGGYNAEFVLGACSDPAMQWQLQLQLVTPQGQLRRLDLPFYSRWGQ
ncbi:hypothetical protein [Rheinheimera sp.]